MKKKKLKKRLDKLETAIFFHEQRIKELEALKPKAKLNEWKKYIPFKDEISPFMAIEITKNEENE